MHPVYAESSFTRLLLAYTIDGKAWKTYGTNRSSGLTFSPGGEPPEIGDSHPLAKELRSLGLPRKPMFTVSVKSTHMTFGKPESINVGATFSS